MKKTLRKIITAFLAIAISFGCLSLAVTAEAPYKMVAFGDVTSQGYMFSDYDTDSETGYLASSSRSTANRMKKYLSSSYTDVRLSDYTFKSLRFNEVIALIDPFETDIDAQCTANLSAYAADCGMTVSQLSDAVIKAVKEADLITFDIGMGQFTSFLVDSLSNVDVGTSYSAMLTELSRKVDPKLSTLLSNMRTALSGFFRSITGADSVINQETLDGLLYFYGSYIDNFKKTMDKIYSYNDDAEVIVMGMYNPLADISVKYGNITFDIDGIANTLVSAIDAYITTINEHRTQYKYASLADGCEIFSDEIASGFFSDDVISLVAKSLYKKDAVKFSAMLYEDIVLKYGLKMNLAPVLKKYLSATITGEMVSDAYSYEGKDQLSDGYSQIRYAFDIIMDAMCSAASYKSIDYETLENDGNMFIALSNYESKKVTDADKIALHTFIRFQGIGGFGMYPSTNGMSDKYSAMKAAFESSYRADGALLQSLMGNVSFITPEMVATITDFIEKFVAAFNSIVQTLSNDIQNVLIDLGLQ